MSFTRWTNWAHITIGTRGSWLPGDPRGFRDHDHRVHSSGDYKNPPPIGEHAALHQFAKSIAPPPLDLPSDLRSTIAEALGEKFIETGHPARIIAVAARHAHALIRAEDDDAKPIAGRAKQAASHAVRRSLPGTIWSQGCHVVRVCDEAHFHAIVAYIAEHEREGAAVWVHPSCRKSDLRG